MVRVFPKKFGNPKQSPSDCSTTPLSFVTPLPPSFSSRRDQPRFSENDYSQKKKKSKKANDKDTNGPTVSSAPSRSSFSSRDQKSIPKKKNKSKKSSSSDDSKKRISKKTGTPDGSKREGFKHFMNAMISDLLAESSVKQSAKPNNQMSKTMNKDRNCEKPSIPKATFFKIIKKIAVDTTGHNFRWKRKAVSCLQQETEAMLVELFDKMAFSAFMNGRKTVMLRDLHVSLYKPRFA